jgi:hypothetical protein
MKGTCMPTSDDLTAKATSGDRRARRITAGVVSVAAVAGLAAGVLIARPGPSASAQTAQAGPAPMASGTRLEAAVAPAFSARKADAGMPRYYVSSLTTGPAVLRVRNSATGKVLSSVAEPAACDQKSFKIAAAGDARTFVVGCETPQSTSQSIAFYRLRITSRGRTSALRPLAIRTPADALNDLALTPDGRKLAIGLQGFNGAPGGIEAVTLTTGRVRTWTGGSPSDLSWVGNGRELGFFGSAGLYALNVNAAGSKLSSARLLLSRTFKADAVQEAKLSPDGTTIFASVTSSNLSVHLHRGSVVGGIVEISARTGKALRTVLTQHAHYSTDGGGSEAGWYVTACLLGPIDATGNHLLVSCDQFGRLDRTRFTALPGVSQDTSFSAAW